MPRKPRQRLETAIEGRGATVIPITLLLVGLAITVAATVFVASASSRRYEQDLRTESEAARTAVERRMSFYTETLYGLRGQFATTEETSRKDFATHILAMSAFERQPGIQALEFSRRVHPDDLAAFEASVRTDESLVAGGYPQFAVHDVDGTPSIDISGDAQQDLYVVDFVEPLAGNEPAFGLDLGSNPSRRRAVEAARDTGTPVITEAISLVQQGEPDTGVLLMVPVYAGGITPATLEERREEFLGVVNGVFLVAGILDDVLGQEPRLELYLYDGTAAAETGKLVDFLLFTSASGVDTEAIAQLEPFEIPLGGRIWVMVARPTELLSAGTGAWFHWIILLGGVLLSISTASLARALVTAEHRALERAARATARLESQADALRQARDQAMAADQTKTGFLANMSHELRTPLTSVIGFSSILRGQKIGSLNEKQQDYVSQIERSGDHLLALINDLLDLSKVEAGREDLDLELVDVDILVESAVVLMREQASSTGISLRSSVSPSVPKIVGDPRRLKQVLVNLLSNSLKFTPSGGAVILEVDLRGRSVEIVIRDSGIGIPESELEAVFAPFHQVTLSGRRLARHGTGLGLAITKHLVELHHGTITVESTPGVGSQFTITLPLVTETAEKNNLATTTDDIEAPTPISVRATVLIADDDAATRHLLVEVLEQAGFATVTATTGLEAVDAVATSAPNLVLMDVDMPDMTGLEATRLLRSDDRLTKIPIVALSASAMDHDRERCLEAGCDDFLSKPFQPEEVISTVVRQLQAGAASL